MRMTWMTNFNWVAPNRYRWPIQLSTWGAVAVIFCLVSWGGEQLDPQEGMANVVWLPAGLMLATLIWRGRDWIPGLMLGGIWSNWLIADHGLRACLLAMSCLFAYGAAAWILRRLDFQPSLERIYDVYLFCGLGAVVASVLYATLATLSCYLTDSYATVDYSWQNWMMSAMLGVLTVAPVILVWSHQPWSFERASTIEAICLAIVCAVANYASFILPGHHVGAIPGACLLFGLMLWAAVRFGQRGSASAMLMICLVALIGHAFELGPWLGESFGLRLLALQSFLVTAVTAILLLGAVTEERHHAIALRDEFLRLAAHELRTPLTVLRLALHNLSRLSLQDTVSASKRMQTKIHGCHAQLDRLTTLVDKLLDAPNIAQGDHMALTRDFLNLGQLTAEVLRELTPRAEGAGCQLTADLDNAVWGSWDRQRLVNVLTHLVDNAIKFGAGKPIAVSVSQNQQQAVIQIQDRGIGLTRRDLGRIFVRFGRATSSAYYGGLGLGLHAARAAVVAHGGRIEVSSRIGQGATFVVILPQDPKLPIQPFG